MTTRICVTNLGFRITNDDLRKHFERFGQLTECNVKKDTAGESRGFAFIAFTDTQSAQHCLSVTSHRICDKAVTLFADLQGQLTNHKIPRSKKLFISLLGLSNICDVDILQTFSMFGEVASVEFDQSEESIEPQFCILYFRSHHSVDSCVSRSHCIQGRPVFVRRATSREEVKLAEQRQRELQAAKDQAKKVYGIHCPTQNVTVVQPRLFKTTSSLLGGKPVVQSNETRKRSYDQLNYTGSLQGASSSLDNYGYMS